HIETRAERTDGGFRLYGQKVFTSRALHSDLMLVVARTMPLGQAQKRTDGLSVFLVDIREQPEGLTIRPLQTMVNHHTTEVFFDGLLLTEDSLVGDQDDGFGHLLDGLNAERILIAAECIGDGRWFVERAVEYANGREVFGRPIGANQGVQFPLARAHAAIEAADLVRYRAAWRFDHDLPCGPDANAAKLLASEASWAAANACLDTHGGYGFVREYDVERKFREPQLHQGAPVAHPVSLAYLGTRLPVLPR